MRRTFLTAACVIVGMAFVAQAAAIRGNAGFGTSIFASNDDSSLSFRPIGFSANFFGITYTDLCLNNNGNVTFAGGSCSGTFTPSSLTAGAQLPRIAVFFADVDTRGAGLDVTYGTDTVGGRPAWGANFIDVDFFFATGSPPGHYPHLNSFQLILIDRSDVSSGDFDIEFNYDRVIWEAGQASGSNVHGLGGTCAHVGYTNGSGLAGTNYSLPGSGACGELLDGGSRALVSHTNVGFDGRYRFEVRSGVITPPPVGNPVPEPATMLLVGSGLIAFARRMRS